MRMINVNLNTIFRTYIWNVHLSTAHTQTHFHIWIRAGVVCRRVVFMCHLPHFSSQSIICVIVVFVSLQKWRWMTALELFVVVVQTNWIVLQFTPSLTCKNCKCLKLDSIFCLNCYAMNRNAVSDRSLCNCKYS